MLTFSLQRFCALLLFLTLRTFGLTDLKESEFLSVDGTSFQINGNTVYLNGVNQPWVNYGDDFGNSQPNAIFCQLNYTLNNVTNNYGNSVRTWLFCGGYNIPEFNSDGYVTATDGTNTLISDLKVYLGAAAEHNILVFISLWNGAVTMSPELIGLINDESKLQSFIDYALIPMVQALQDYPAMGGWEIINEPEGSITIESNSVSCYNTMPLMGSGAGWAGNNINMENMLRFIGLQASAIHTYDSKALVTIGSWNAKADTDNFGYFNFYKDECLQMASNKSNGILDFYQIHSYANSNGFDSVSPFSGNSASAYGLDKPIVVGEFASQDSYGMSVSSMYNYLYDNGYNGGWDWCAIGGSGVDDMKLANEGMSSLSGKSDIKIYVNPNGDSPSARCWCSDIPPSTGYTCEQQALWGKCDQSWMTGYCCQSCDSCSGCD